LILEFQKAIELRNWNAKKRLKDEILTPSNNEGERARGDEGEKNEIRRGFRMTAF